MSGLCDWVLDPSWEHGGGRGIGGVKGDWKQGGLWQEPAGDGASWEELGRWGGSSL